MSLPVGIAEKAPLEEILGYLNFSSGTRDSVFLGHLNELWKAMQSGGVPQAEFCAIARQLLAGKLAELTGSSPTFQNTEQAEICPAVDFCGSVAVISASSSRSAVSPIGMPICGSLFSSAVWRKRFWRGRPLERNRANCRQRAWAA